MGKISLPQPSAEPTPQVEWGRKLHTIINEHWVHTARERRWARDAVIRAEAQLTPSLSAPRARPGRDPALLIPLVRLGSLEWLVSWHGDRARLQQVLDYARWLWGVGAPLPDDDDAHEGGDAAPSAPREDDAPPARRRRPRHAPV